MLDLVAEDNSPDVFRILLVFELCRVHANDYKLVCVFVFKTLQIRNDVHAVDATVRPEIKKHHLAFQRRKRKWCLRIQPAAATFKLRRTHAGIFLYRHVRTFPG